MRQPRTSDIAKSGKFGLAGNLTGGEQVIEVDGQRWQIESGFSMIKRRVSEGALAMNYHRKRRLLLLNTITLNPTLLCYIALFY